MHLGIVGRLIYEILCIKKPVYVLSVIMLGKIRYKSQEEIQSKIEEYLVIPIPIQSISNNIYNRYSQLSRNSKTIEIVQKKPKPTEACRTSKYL